MKRTLLCMLVIINSFIVQAQIEDGIPYDSTIVRFSYGAMANYLPDTAATPLWQIGHSRKAFFNIDTTGQTTIMTDSLNAYPVNANNWFIIKLPGWYGIIDFWHRYQTDSGFDGGVVEFSLDIGHTWQNVKGACNTDSMSSWAGIRTENFYTFNDTLTMGTPAFTGTKSTTQFSRFQFWLGPPVKSTSGDCLHYTDSIYVRFRFISDTVADSLAGWIIDSIKIENDQYYGSVGKVNNDRSLSISPNPSANGHFIFPALKNKALYNLAVINSLGQTVLKIPYKEAINLSGFSRGLYFYKVTDGTEYYSGRLLYE